VVEPAQDATSGGPGPHSRQRNSARSGLRRQLVIVRETERPPSPALVDTFSVLAYAPVSPGRQILGGRGRRLCDAVCFFSSSWSPLACWQAPPAAVTTYTGLDPGAGPADPRPNSSAAAASFDAAAAALGPRVTENFESAPLGNFATLPLANTTVTLTGTASDSGAGITTSTLGPAILGYNTTSGGANYLRFNPLSVIGTSSVEFTFPRPVQARPSDESRVRTNRESRHSRLAQDATQRGGEGGNRAPSRESGSPVVDWYARTVLLARARLSR